MYESGPSCKGAKYCATFLVGITSPGPARTLADHFHRLFFMEQVLLLTHLSLKNFLTSVRPTSFMEYTFHLENFMGLSNLPRPQCNDVKQATKEFYCYRTLGWVYTRVQVRGASVQNTPSCSLFSSSRLHLNLKFRFSNQEYFLEVWTVETCRESDAALAWST